MCGKVGAKGIALTKRKSLCTVEAMKKFLKARGNTPGVLFAYPDGSHFARSSFDKTLGKRQISERNPKRDTVSR